MNTVLFPPPEDPQGQKEWIGESVDLYFLLRRKEIGRSLKRWLDNQRKEYEQTMPYMREESEVVYYIPREALLPSYTLPVYFSTAKQYVSELLFEHAEAGAGTSQDRRCYEVCG